jgi:Na+-transporting NADH:ubiquinone oxidoreductase subunit C
MNRDSNLYIFIYASVMVIIVAAVLSFTAETLKLIQKENVRIEKIQNLLESVGIPSEKSNAAKIFDDCIPEENRITINSKGEKVEGNAFDINLKLENKKNIEDRVLPVYIVNMDDGTKKTIVPLLGIGLWGPKWGYISFEPDNNTIFGAVFDHKGETPGLGADINKDWFEKPFAGKTIFEGDKFVSITVHKGGKGAAEIAGDMNHGVDAISGGTITSKGLEKMIYDCLVGYQVYFKNNKDN